MAGELYFGVLKLRHAARTEVQRNRADELNLRVHGFLRELAVLPFDATDALFYGIVRASLQRRGKTVGGNDMQIASQARARNLTLVTDDGDFDWIEDLKWENWVDPQASPAA